MISASRKRGSNQGNLVQEHVRAIQGSGYKALMEFTQKPTKYGLLQDAKVSWGSLKYSGHMNIAAAKTASQSTLSALFDPKCDDLNLKDLINTGERVEANITLATEIVKGFGSEFSKNSVKAQVTILDSDDATEKLMYGIRLKPSAINVPDNNNPSALCLYGKELWPALTTSIYCQLNQEFTENNEEWNQGIIYANEDVKAGPYRIAEDGISLVQRLVLFVYIPMDPKLTVAKREIYFAKKMKTIGMYHMNSYLASKWKLPDGNDPGDNFTHSIICTSPLCDTKYDRKFIMITFRFPSTLVIEVLEGEHALDDCCVVTFASNARANAIKEYHLKIGEESVSTGDTRGEKGANKKPKNYLTSTDKDS
jgi:hypothetical protein